MRLSRLAVGCAAFGVAIVAAGCLPTPPPPGPHTVGFACAGVPQFWVVPAGVTSITVDALGAQGGTSSTSPTPSAGRGAEAIATVPVTPGEMLTIVAGCSGANAPSITSGGAGGFGGGARGGSGLLQSGGGGGGASTVFRITTPIVVAGGGGGAGADGCRVAIGGDGGGLTGVLGGPGSAVACGDLKYGGGGGGTQIGGGVGGLGITGGANGSVGTFGTGGQGADSTTRDGGGGGGGGYFGGGGGGAAENFTGLGVAAGGGGGSGFGPPATVFHFGAQTGPGVVTITYTA